MKTLLVSIAASLVAQVGFAAFQLDFNAAAPGTINDATGLGTGFTHRLPLTGSAIPANDANLTLNTALGHLLLTSQRSDFNTSGFGRNLNALDAPALLLSGIGATDFLVRAKFLNIHVDQLSDQVGIFVGASANNVVRAGVHEPYQAFLINSQNGIDVAPTLGTNNQFAAGNDAIFEIGRIGGQWHYSWQNVTTPALAGSFQSIALPDLNSQTDLYVGVFNLDARNISQQVATLDYFTVLIGSEVPEPTSIVVWGVLVSFSLVTLRIPRQTMLFN